MSIFDMISTEKSQIYNGLLQTAFHIFVWPTFAQALDFWTVVYCAIRDARAEKRQVKALRGKRPDITPLSLLHKQAPFT